LCPHFLGYLTQPGDMRIDLVERVVSWLDSGKGERGITIAIHFSSIASWSNGHDDRFR
jgi:hypothetical protein